MRQNFLAQFIQFLNHWLCALHFVDQCQLQALRFSVHLIDLLSILLICNGFTGVQKAVVDQTSSRPPESDHDFFGASLALGSALEFLLITELLVVSGCHIKSTFRCTSQSKKWFTVVQSKRRHSKMTIFFICHQLTRHALTKLFHPSGLLQMLNNYRKVDTELLGNLSRSCKRIIFDDGTQLLATSDGQPLCSSSLRLVSFAKLPTTTALYVHQQFLSQMPSCCYELSPLLYDLF